MARKYKNESYLSVSVDNLHEGQQENSVSKVKIPYFFNVTIQTKIGKKNDGNPIYGETDIISKEPFPKVWDIVKTEPAEITFLNKCPKCEKEGRPRVNKKNNKDYTHYNTTYDRKEYRLAYWHKVEGKKDKPCIIARFDEKHGIFTKTGKISKRVEDFIFPNYLTNESNV